VRFIEETGFNARVGHEEAFQRWLVANEARIASAYPEGTEYLGTYATVFTSEKTAGSWRVLERLSSYADIDRLSAMAKDETSEFAKVWREFTRFMDPDPHADWSHVLLRNAVDATVWDFEPGE